METACGLGAPKAMAASRDPFPCHAPAIIVETTSDTNQRALAQHTRPRTSIFAARFVTISICPVPKSGRQSAPSSQQEIYADVSLGALTKNQRVALPPPFISFSPLFSRIRARCFHLLSFHPPPPLSLSFADSMSRFLSPSRSPILPQETSALKAFRGLQCGILR
ncbi:conserved hypothetical protein [Neospora caninum Liverpool]|uniref:Uncharacterized protein n=1 Tax=Neospora caninum (strain Liverpool) TaxID=572307 RepID=F0VLM2_NEOCL|nr:conserved hypothetical protein [Neospora caninum Liverpool]CBZ54150.1 conserved hypothetical protein [Neospora caninum Liverpool]CEL68850.1 TPA: hypothetical protein BN1204_045820 [Neospora caninum Liverpool]|eukprot:XP_003884181.1 conserved hypothetical protein [Neospora caninum Liverpool]